METKVIASKTVKIMYLYVIIITITMDRADCLEIMEDSNFWNPLGLFRHVMV